MPLNLCKFLTSFDIGWQWDENATRFWTYLIMVIGILISSVLIISSNYWVSLFIP